MKPVNAMNSTKQWPLAANQTAILLGRLVPRLTGVLFTKVFAGFRQVLVLCTSASRRCPIGDADGCGQTECGDLAGVVARMLTPANTTLNLHLCDRSFLFWCKILRFRS